MLPPTAKPYLLRAIYDWCLAEGHTPHVLVASAHPGVRFPAGYDKGGKLTLNIAPRAVQGLDLGLDRIRFAARFGGRVEEVEVPLVAVVAVFAAETHDGLVFGEPPAPAQALESESAVPDGEAPAAPEAEAAPETAPEAAPETEPAPAPGKGGPRLRLVK